MDWSFTDVLDYNGQTYRVACFAVICHYCGQRYIEFFPNVRQENLFIGMIHAFRYMGIPRSVLTDNMKSVVLHCDLQGHPVWQKDYEAFMKPLASKQSAVSLTIRLPKVRWNARAVRKRGFSR